MKKVIWSVFFILLMITQAQALIILTNKAINFNQKKSGVLKGNIVLGNKVQKAIGVGNYKVSSNGKEVVFNISSIIKDNQTHNLSSQPSVIKPLKGKKVLKKGSKLILAGENQEEIAKIFGISLQDYQKKSGTNATSNSSSSNSSAGSSSGSSGSSSGGGSSNSGGSFGGSGSFGSGVSSGSYGGGSSNSGGSFGSSGSGSFGGFSDSGGSSYGSGYIPSSNSSSDGTNYYPVPTGNGSNGGGKNGDSTSEYSTQFCKSPAYNGKNAIGLSFIAKDGSCVDIQAQRDDTKCEYRYDFNEGVAIKQTQFYYVDNENQMKNVGGCVDLQGDEYRFPLYKDDSKCQLQTIKDKGYNGNQAYFFQTQILFRGADGLVHTAINCSDYQNVQEELISYDKDSKKREVKRVVNQYYIDPKSGDKIYINNGIISPFKFPYQEYACGAWEFDDANLQAYRRTQIKAFDNVANQYIDITGCDYGTDEGKKGRIIQPYIKLPTEEKAGGIEDGDMNGTYEFEIKERVLNSSKTRFYYGCSDFWSSWTHWQDEYSYYNGGFKTYSKWKTTYKTTNTGVTEAYQRPKQEDEKEPSIYYANKKIKTIDRTTVIIQNELDLDKDYMKYYEVNENFYKDESIKTTSAFTDFISKYYRPGNGFCEAYSIWDIKHYDNHCRTWWGHSEGVSCTLHSNYLLPTKK